MATSQGSKPAAWNAPVISRSELLPSSRRIATLGFRAAGGPPGRSAPA